MPDERTRTEQQNAASLPPPADTNGAPDDPAGPYERFIHWAAELPWWAIILVIVAVAVLYSMLTSAAYTRVIRFLTDDPQTSTDDLYDAVLIVGHEIEVVGDFDHETTDTVGSVINQLLRKEGTPRAERAGFVVNDTPARLVLQTDDGLVTIPKEDIIAEERSEVDGQTLAAVVYLDTETVAGVVTEINNDRFIIRVEDEEAETFATSRILSREVIDTVTCNPDEDMNCRPGEIVTIQREGELLTGTLNTLSTTQLNMDVSGEEDPREIRLLDTDYIVVATLGRAVNESAAKRAITNGDSVRIGYFEAADTQGFLGDIVTQESATLPLVYADGEVNVELVAYDAVDALLAATDAGEIDGMIYIASGQDRTDLEAWLEDNPEANVAGIAELRCTKDCAVTVKLEDDEITGRVAKETEREITIVTTESEFVRVDRDTVIEERKLEPGACAFNNLRGCDEGIFLTIRVTVIAYILAVLIGLIVGIMRVQTNAVTLGDKIMQTIFTSLSTLYVEVIRGIPLLVILLYAGFVLRPELRDGLLLFDLQWFGDSMPDFQIRPKYDLSMEWGAIIGLAFGYGAFIAEIFRAGIQSINRGQMEAARSLGMSYPQAMRYVVLPQAVRVVLPPLGNDFIAMLKDSALISVLALPDLLQMGRLYVSRTFRAFDGYNTVAVLYLLMTLFLSTMVRIIERRTRLPG